MWQVTTREAAIQPGDENCLTEPHSVNEGVSLAPALDEHQLRADGHGHKSDVCASRRGQVWRSLRDRNGVGCGLAGFGRLHRGSCLSPSHRALVAARRTKTLMPILTLPRKRIRNVSAPTSLWNRVGCRNSGKVPAARIRAGHWLDCRSQSCSA